jgi:hypothetical protein
VLLITVVLWPAAARAQSWVTDVQLSLASGLEGGDTGLGPGWQRARTRVVVGLDLGNDETPYEAYGVRAFVEMERSVTLGAEVGYVRWVLPELNVFFGGVAVLAPDTLLGATAAITYIWPLGKRLGIPIWASLNALPFGSDRSADGVIVWTLLGVGVRGRL